MSDAIEDLFQTIRGACSSQAWSRGVELVRGEAVCGERDSGDEVILRVSAPGSAVSPTVVLLPEDEEWECNCRSRDDVCDHVAASVIALRRARKAGEDLPGASASAAGRIAYRLRREGGTLYFERVVVTGDKETLLRSTLGAISSGRVDGPRFAATQADIEVERALGTRLRGDLPRGVWPGLLQALAGCSDITLDGEPITASAERKGWAGVVEDDGLGFRVRVRPDPRIEETFEGGIARAGNLLCLVGEARLTGREREELIRGRHFIPERAAELVTEVLPELKARIPVSVTTNRLPAAEIIPPRLLLDVQREGDALCVFPMIVYGDPPSAHVVSGRLLTVGDGPIPIRDEGAERTLERRLQSQLELASGHRAKLTGNSAMRLAERLKKFSGDLRGDAHRSFFRVPPLVPQLDFTDAGFDLRFEVEGEEGGKATPKQAVSPEAVVRAFHSGESLVPLTGGGFAPLPRDWLSRHGDRVADLLAARDDRGNVSPAAYPDLARLCEELDAPVPPDVAALRARLESEPPSAALPDDLQAELRDYQREGVSWLANLRDAGLGALLADDMGLGKTLQALCAMRGRTLVVAPASVVHNWASELRRFRPGLRYSVYHGAGRELEAEADVTLTTWALLRIDADKLSKISWDTLVLDEAQAIKNPDSQVARAAFRMQADFRVALTGTPVENRLEELWSQFQVLNRGLLGARKDFDGRYARPIGNGEPDAAARLRDRIRPFVLRRLKRDVATELPPRTDVVLRAELSVSERAVYDAVRAATRKEVVEKLSQGTGVLQALEALLRLRQAACHPSLVPGQEAETSAKLNLLTDRLEQVVAEGHKALVFSQWTSLLDLIEPQLAASDIGFSRLDGSTRDREGVVNGFQREEGPPVLLLSLRAGGVGLNLTQADHVFIVDPWWNPAAEDQAADRAHRIGQDRPVMVYRLVAANTVEEGILALQERKRGLAEAALGEAEGRGAITRDELMDLLGSALDS
jgi:superfamily II DNA or RNA helicase